MGIVYLKCTLDQQVIYHKVGYDHKEVAAHSINAQSFPSKSGMG